MIISEEKDYELEYEKKLMADRGEEGFLFALPTSKIFLEHLENCIFKNERNEYLQVQPVYEKLGKVRYIDKNGNFPDIHDITSYNKDGKEYGVRRIYFKNQNNSNIDREIPYRNGKIHGTVRNYRPDGSLAKEIDYYDDNKSAERIYNSKGALNEEINYDTNTRKKYNKNSLEYIETIYSDNTKETFTYDEKGHLISKAEYYSNGELHKLIEYSTDTKTSEQSNLPGTPRPKIEHYIEYDENKETVREEIYYPSGKIQTAITGPTSNQLITSYYDNPRNSKQSEGTYCYEKPTGQHKQYYPSGQIACFEYRNDKGEHDGPIISYHENGNVKAFGLYRSAKLHGYVHTYEENGTPKDLILFDNGEEIASKSLTEAYTEPKNEHLSNVKAKLDSLHPKENNNPLESLDKDIFKRLQGELETLREFKNSDIDEETKEAFVKILDDEMKSTNKYGMGLTPDQIKAVKQQNPDLFPCNNSQQNIILQKKLAEKRLHQQ